MPVGSGAQQTAPQSVAHGLEVVAANLGRNSETGAFVRGMFGRSAVVPVPLAAATPLPLAYYGGPVQTDPKIYLVWWGPNWQTGVPGAEPALPGTDDPQNERAYVKAFIRAAQGSRWLNDVLQYTQADSQQAANSAQMLAGSWNDVAAVPNDATHPDAADLDAEALKAARYYGAVGINAHYVILLPSGVKVHAGQPAGWCAWHTYRLNLNNKIIPYTVMSYLHDRGTFCGNNAVHPKPGGALDGVSIVLGHEIAEMITDPQISTQCNDQACTTYSIINPTAWDDANNEEIGDTCSWINTLNNMYVTDLAHVAGYPTQPLWDIGLMRCRQGPQGY